MYIVTLENGTTFSDLDINGSYFVSKTEVTRDMFNNWNGKYRVVSDNNSDELGIVGEHTDCELKDVFKGARWWYFALGEIDKAQREALRDRADIDYIAMMTGVEL